MVGPKIYGVKTGRLGGWGIGRNFSLPKKHEVFNNFTPGPTFSDRNLVITTWDV